MVDTPPLGSAAPSDGIGSEDHVVDLEHGSVFADAGVRAVRLFADADEARADAAAHALFERNVGGNALPRHRRFQRAEHGRGTAGEHNVGLHLVEILHESLHRRAVEAHRAVVRGEHELFAPREFVFHAQRGAVAEAHIGVDLLGLAVRADGGDERENAHAAAHDGDFLLRILDVKAVAEGQQDGELFARLIFARQSPRAAAFEAVTDGDAFALRLAYGNGTAERKSAHADHAELPGTDGDLVVRGEREHINFVGDAFVFKHRSRYFAHISPNTDARSAFIARQASRAAP